ncbi:MAG: hypothetical protein KDD64_12090 [Bdellovibrionales bacterium]|nr:hypothetical protein [Bdellovibrionales bacterium]
MASPKNHSGQESPDVLRKFMSSMRANPVLAPRKEAHHGDRMAQMTLDGKGALQINSITKPLL